MSDGARRSPPKTTIHFVAGLGSGLLSAVLLQPIDLLKTRVQQSGTHRLSTVLADLRASSPHLVPALWRGAVPSALRTGFGSAIYFTSLNAVRQHVARVAGNGAGSAGRQPSSSSLPRLSNTGNLLAGGGARAFAGFILMPLTVIKVRYESNLYAYRSIASAARDIAARDGLRGFFAGYGATAIRDAPYAGLYVLFYEQCKRRLSALYGRGGTRGDGDAAVVPMDVSRAAAINFSSGAVAAAACSAVSNPFDAVKTRIQLQPARYPNMWQAAARMLREDGFRSFWDGLALRMSRKAMSSALAWTLYEELVRRAEAAWSRTTRSDVL